MTVGYCLGEQQSKMQATSTINRALGNVFIGLDSVFIYPDQAKHMPKNFNMNVHGKFLTSSLLTPSTHHKITQSTLPPFRLYN